MTVRGARRAVGAGGGPLLVLLVSVGLCVAVVTRATAHEPAVLDPHRATPSVRLELVEAPPTAASALASPSYRLVATGLPDGMIFNVWTRDYGHSFHEAASGFRKDETGRLVAVRHRNRPAQYLDELVLEPGPYPRGAIWEVALASEDRTITAFATVIPRPIATRDGACVVSLELVSHRGERFLARGSGFVPGTEVRVESQYAGRVTRRIQRASADGHLPPDVLIHAAATASDNRALYTVKAGSCAVVLEYAWGRPALRPN